MGRGGTRRKGRKGTQVDESSESKEEEKVWKKMVKQEWGEVVDPGSMGGQEARKVRIGTEKR